MNKQSLSPPNERRDVDSGNELKLRASPIRQKAPTSIAFNESVPLKAPDLNQKSNLNEETPGGETLNTKPGRNALLGSQKGTIESDTQSTNAPHAIEATQYSMVQELRLIVQQEVRYVHRLPYTSLDKRRMQD
jgi:hypothetical protein